MKNQTKLFYGVLVISLLFGLMGCLSWFFRDSEDDSDTSSQFNFESPEIVYVEVPYSELREEIAKIKSPGHGFIVEAYFNATNAPGEGSFSIGEKPIPNPTDKDRYWIGGHNENDWYYSGQYEKYRTKLKFEQYDDQTYKRIDKNKPYRIYISVHNFFRADEYYDSTTGKVIKVLRWSPKIDKIEGLRSLEEVAAIEAKQKAEREAAEEAKRRAREEANRYNPAKFIIVPSDFKPADYAKVDLFAAVAASERLSAAHEYWGYVDIGPPSRDFVSDVVFVSQNGTDIVFRTEDNAIRQRMKVGSRTGLTSGQKVRVYYRAYNLQDWQVAAIERL
jgi:hypothetical protein